MITIDSQHRSLSSDEIINTGHCFDLSPLKRNKKFNKYIKLISANNELTEKIESAVEWLGKFYNHNDSKCRYLYLIICLEALFNTDVDKYSSITAIVSEKSALLYKANERERIFNKIKSLYKARNEIVHSGSTDKFSTLKDDYLLVLNTIEKYMDLIIKNNFKNKKEVNNYFFKYKLRF